MESRDVFMELEGTAQEHDIDVHTDSESRNIIQPTSTLQVHPLGLMLLDPNGMTQSGNARIKRGRRGKRGREVKERRPNAQNIKIEKLITHTVLFGYGQQCPRFPLVFVLSISYTHVRTI
jgi:hypothetical protein